MTTNLNLVSTAPGRQVGGVSTGVRQVQTSASTTPSMPGVIVRTVNTGDDMYFEQDFTNSSQWHVIHGLGKVPGVSVYDAVGDEIGADVQADVNTVTVTWPGPTTGKLVCS